MLRYWRSILHLFYPELCMGCNCALVDQEKLLCISCLYHLPYSNFHLDHDNEIVRQLKGKFKLEFACSMLYLKSDSLVEQLIYNLKYNNHPQVGFYLGREYARQLIKTSWFNKIDVIIPIPLNKKRLLKRGYNQSEYFAKGLSFISGIPVETSVLKRSNFKSSQTQMSRIDRIENVTKAFYCKCPELLKDKNILVVDDVLTTGATVTSAAEEIMSTVLNCKIYFVSIARAL